VTESETVTVTVTESETESESERATVANMNRIIRVAALCAGVGCSSSSPAVCTDAGTIGDSQQTTDVVPSADGGPAVDCSELVVVANGESGPFYLQLDAQYLYWLNLAGTVRRVSLSGGVPETLSTYTGQSFGLAVDSEAVYWSLFAAGAIFKQPLSATGTPTMVTSGLPGPRFMIVQSGVIYVSTSVGIQTVPTSGGTATPLVPLTNMNSEFAIYQDTIYLSNSEYMYTAPITGGAPKQLEANMQYDYPVAAAASADGLFFTANPSVAVGVVRKGAVDGTGLTTIVSATVNPQWVAVDSTSLYWFSGGDTSGMHPSNLYVATLDGSNARQLTRGSGLARSFAMNDTFIYGADPQSGLIYRYCKTGQPE
jgi:hypothetical protein